MIRNVDNSSYRSPSSLLLLLSVSSLVLLLAERPVAMRPTLAGAGGLAWDTSDVLKTTLPDCARCISRLRDQDHPRAPEPIGEISIYFIASPDWPAFRLSLKSHGVVPPVPRPAAHQTRPFPTSLPCDLPNSAYTALRLFHPSLHHCLLDSFVVWVSRR